MKRISKTGRDQRRQRTVPLPPTGRAGDPVAGPPEEPDTPGVGPTPRIDARAIRDPARTDIERADERKGGSVENITHTESAAGLASFTEAAGGDSGDPATAPYLREG